MQTQQFLQQKGQSITTLHEKYKIRSSTHPDQTSFPLIVLNYDNIQSPRDEQIVNECRGLVLELNSWKIVARGMTRFFNQHHSYSSSPNIRGLNDDRELVFLEQDQSPSLEKSKLFDYSNFSLETKEDGTFLLMFCYEGEWMIATRHNFCEDYLAIGSETQKTYRELFVEICGGVELNEIGKDLNPSLTYCLEMCSSQNEIVQIYQNPVIYLLTIVETQSGKELSRDQVDKICLKLRKRAELKNWKRPKRFENFSSLEQALKHLDTFISTHENVEARLRIEGFIMRDTNNQRLKLKNPFYLLIHKMKYRGWIQATPKFLIPFIVHFEDYKKSSNSEKPFIISVLSKYYECEYEMKELEVRYQYCKNILQKEIVQLESLWSTCSKMNEQEFETFQNDPSVKNRSRLFDLIKVLKNSTCSEKPTLSQLLKNNSTYIVAQLFSGQSQQEAFESAVLSSRASKHSENYCQPAKKLKVTEPNNGLAKTKPFLDKKTNQYKVQCYCGKAMVLKRLKRDLVQYRKCHCGKCFDIHTYKVGTLLYQCTSYPKCLLNHEAHQRDEMFSDEKIQYYKGQPLGIPSSELCKIYRLQIHEIMSILMKKNNWKKSQCYQLIAEWLKVEKSQAHVALFSIETCLFVISKFIDNYNIYN